MDGSFKRYNKQKFIHALNEKIRRDKMNNIIHRMKNQINNIKPNYLKKSSKEKIIYNVCELIINMKQEQEQLEKEIIMLTREENLSKQNKNCHIIASYYEAIK